MRTRARSKFVDFAVNQSSISSDDDLEQSEQKRGRSRTETNSESEKKEAVSSQEHAGLGKDCKTISDKFEAAKMGKGLFQRTHEEHDPIAQDGIIRFDSVESKTVAVPKKFQQPPDRPAKETNNAHEGQKRSLYNNIKFISESLEPNQAIHSPTAHLQQISSIKSEPSLPESKNRTINRLNNLLEVELDEEVEEIESDNCIIKCAKGESGDHDSKLEVVKHVGWDPERFIFRQLRYDQKFIGKLQRKNDGINCFVPQFDLFFREEFRYVLSSKKTMDSKVSMYFSTDQAKAGDNPKRRCGRLMSNFTNTQFYLQVPSKQRSCGFTKICETKFKDKQDKALFNPRNYETYILKQNIDYMSLEGTTAEDQLRSLELLYQMYPHNRDKMYYFRSRTPEYIQRLQAYFLNFQGRVEKGSVKNFIMEDPKSGREVLMFGKGVGTNSFNLEFRHPLSPLLAMSMVMPHFTGKLFN